MRVMIGFRKSTVVVGLLSAWVLSFGLAGRILCAEDKVRVLIVDGQNNHNWRAMTPPMKADLERSGRFTVDVATTPRPKAPASDWDAFRPDFSKYDVVLSNYNGDSWPPDVRKSLEEYVADGGGLAIVHAANNAFEGWPAYNEMIGLGWRNPRFGDRLTIDDSGHVVRTPKGQGPPPATVRCMPSKSQYVSRITRSPMRRMHAKDELYHGQRGPAKHLEILATAYSDKAKEERATNEPMIYVIRWQRDAFSPR